jgi:hypothetical protein
MKNVILIAQIQGILKYHSFVDNNLGRPKKGTPHPSPEVEHVIMCENNSNTKKNMDASYNSLPPPTHQIAPQHFVQ